MISKIKSLSLGIRIIAVAMLVMIAVVAVNYVVFVRGYTGSAYTSLIDQAAAFTAVADESKNHTASMWERNAINRDGLIKELEEFQAAGRSYREAAIFDALPIVAGWTAAEQAASREGVNFRISAFNARNPENEPAPGSFEESLLRTLTSQVSAKGQESIHGIDRQTNTLHYMRAITLTQDCMVCHGNPGPNNPGGRDLLDFPMEGWDVGRMHGSYHVMMPLDTVDAQVTSFITGGLTWTVPLSIGGALLFIWLLRSMFGRPIGALIDRIVNIQETKDLTQRVDVDSNDEIGKLGQIFNSLVETLHDTIAQVSSGTTQVDAGAGQIAQTSQSLAEGASEQASSLEQISASIEQMSAMTQQNAENSKQASAVGRFQAIG